MKKLSGYAYRVFGAVFNNMNDFVGDDDSALVASMVLCYFSVFYSFVNGNLATILAAPGVSD